MQANSDHVYIAFIRGVNVGGKSSVPMSELRSTLQEIGFTEVQTVLNSGNVILRSSDAGDVVSKKIEAVLSERFDLAIHAGGVHVLSGTELANIIHSAPKEFGQHPDTFHSDVIFLMGVTVDEARVAFTPREGVDVIWEGQGVFYSQRLSAKRSMSRLNRVMQHPVYKSMTIRTWNTVHKLNSAALALEDQHK
jgi:uncharacterized protein (DUF1697 family)